MIKGKKRQTQCKSKKKWRGVKRVNSEQGISPLFIKPTDRRGCSVPGSLSTFSITSTITATLFVLCALVREWSVLLVLGATKYS